jgi:threonine aldolase
MHYSFKNDYSEIAHPEVLKALSEAPATQEPGYGEDAPTKRAERLILKCCGLDKGQVRFVVGGTLTNLVVAAAFLKPFESIIAAESGHICQHEAGAIEATGHKVHHLSHIDGKISAEQVRQLVAIHQDDHMVRPAMVYISQSTELGTIYSLSELEELSRVCRENGLLFYIDGARLGSALASERADFTLSDIASLSDVFYFGGTKNGALFGEAVVLREPKAGSDLTRLLKQRGAILAKGQALGLQFEALFKDDMWLRLARHANSMATRLANGIAERGYDLAYKHGTNQIFPVFPAQVVKKLEQLFGFYIWRRIDSDSVVIRLVTSWATKDAQIDKFLAELK